MSVVEWRGLPRVEVGSSVEFVFTDITVERLDGGMVRLLFFCEQRPLDPRLDAETRLKACGVTSLALVAGVLRKLELGAFEAARLGH